MFDFELDEPIPKYNADLGGRIQIMFPTYHKNGNTVFDSNLGYDTSNQVTPVGCWVSPEMRIVVILTE